MPSKYWLLTRLLLEWCWRATAIDIWCEYNVTSLSLCLSLLNHGNLDRIKFEHISQAPKNAATKFDKPHVCVCVCVSARSFIRFSPTPIIVDSMHVSLFNFCHLIFADNRSNVHRIINMLCALTCFQADFHQANDVRCVHLRWHRTDSVMLEYAFFLSLSIEMSWNIFRVFVIELKALAMFNSLFQSSVYLLCKVISRINQYNPNHFITEFRSLLPFLCVRVRACVL